jgi:hypothetical protein
VNNSVFGSGCPSYEYGSDSVYLHYSSLDPKFSEKEQKMFLAPIAPAGDRTCKVRGKYASFNVGIRLYLYDENPQEIVDLPTAKEMALILLSHENHDVTFYPFSSGNTPYGAQPIMNTSGDIVPCRLFDIQPDFLDKAGGTMDYWTLTFLTNKFYDMSKLIPQ